MIKLFLEINYHFLKRPNLHQSYKLRLIYIHLFGLIYINLHLVNFKYHLKYLFRVNNQAFHL